MLFGVPDRIPLEPGWPRLSTLHAWRKQGLPEDANWEEVLFQTLGIPIEPHLFNPALDVNFAMLPTFQEKVLDHRGGHYLVQDWMGAIVEISDQYDYTYLRTAKDFVTRQWHRFPAQNREDWERKLKWRYNPHSLERFPADFQDRCAKLRDREHVLRLDFNGPFWQLREWFGLKGLCILMAEQPGFVEEMVEFWQNFVLQVLEQILIQVVPDHVQISEDMAFKMHSIISPGMVRSFLLPTWKTWINTMRNAGCPVITIDSDGYVAELIPLWIEAGFNGTWPVEAAAGNDLPFFRKLYGRNMGYGGGIDKRLLAAGGKVMEAEIKRVEPVILSGGYIPGCDHGVPPDISWSNFMEYTKRLAQMTGWL